MKEKIKVLVNYNLRRLLRVKYISEERKVC